MSKQHQAGLGELLRHLSDLVDRSAQSAYQAHNLNYRPRYTPVMRLLADGPCSVSEITEALSITQGAVSQSLKRMQDDGLVTRRSGEDARQNLYALTDQGQALLGELQQHWQATFKAIEALEDETGTALRHVLKKSIAALEKRSFAERIQQALEDGEAARSSNVSKDAAGHFLSGGEDYARYRPSYPQSLAASLAKLCPAQGLALDIGCGNGQLSAVLATQFEQVIATDVSADQLAHAETTANIDYRCESAETLSANDQSADLIVAAQAAHWFDLPLFYKEVRRVAKPDAIIALLSYGVPSLDGPADNYLQRFYWQTVHEYWPPERRHPETGYLEIAFPFEALEAPTLDIERRWDLDALIGYLGTWSGTRRAIAAGRGDILNELRDELRPHYRGAQRIHWPLNMRLGRIR